MKHFFPILLALSLITGCASRTSLPNDPADWLAASEDPKVSAALRAIDKARAVVHDNLLNADTTGFKRSTALRSADGRLQIALDMTQGSMQSTRRPFDLAISGSGFFRVKGRDGQILYTRNGNLFVDRENRLVLGLGDGLLLDPPVTIPAHTTEINVSESGAVQALVEGQLQKQPIGQITLYQFVAADQLHAVRAALLQATERSGEPVACQPGEDGAGTLLQGYLESSNVQIEIERERAAFLTRWREAVVGMR